MVWTPRLVGLSVARAGDVAAAHQVRMVGEEPEGSGSLTGMAFERIGATVLSQRPPTGTAVTVGSAVVVTWREGGSGVREPRRPPPDPLVLSRARVFGDDGSGRARDPADDAEKDSRARPGRWDHLTSEGWTGR